MRVARCGSQGVAWIRLVGWVSRCLASPAASPAQRWESIGALPLTGSARRWELALRRVERDRLAPWTRSSTFSGVRRLATSCQEKGDCVVAGGVRGDRT